MARYIIKVNKNKKAYFSKVTRNGKAQIEFAEKIGKPVGACVAAATKGKSFNRHEQTAILSDCVKATGMKGFGKLGYMSPTGYYARKAEGKVGHGQAYTRPY
ncbi:MAG: hypothetical protein ABSF14_21290 [Terriglobia bacterium]|jgi:hypothetical protein